MLGRLRLSIDDCITAYAALSSCAFQKVKHRINIKGNVQGRFDEDALKRTIQDVVEAAGLERDALLKDDPKAPCKVAVFATRKENDSVVGLLSCRSDRYMRDMLDNVTIWEAARATSAASSFFDPISIGDYGEQYVDGATSCNNPVREVIATAQDIWRDVDVNNSLACLVSIGTGQPSLAPFGDHILDIAKTLKKIATDTEYLAEQFSREHRSLGREKRYFRFNVEKGLEDVGLEEYAKKSTIVAATRRHLELQHVFEQIQACAGSIRTGARTVPGEQLLVVSGAALDVGEWQRMLVHAIQRMNINATKDLLRYPHSLSFRNDQGYAPLGAAVVTGKLDLVRCIVERGADVKFKESSPLMTDREGPPLCWAAYSGHLNIVDYLLEQGADMNCHDTSRCTPLHHAAWRGHVEIVRRLIRRGGAKVLSKNSEDALIYASYGGHLEIVKEMSKDCQNVKRKLGGGRNSVHFAASRGHTEICTFLLARDQELLEETEDTKMTPLALALESQQWETAVALIDMGAMLPAIKAPANALAMLAVKHDKASALRTLFEKHPSTGPYKEESYTWLHLAAVCGAVNCGKYLSQIGFDVRAVDGDRCTTPLHKAINEKKLDFVSFLLDPKWTDIGVNEVVRITDQARPIHSAARIASSDIVSLLLQKGADTSLRLSDGSTTLQLAAKSNEPDAARIIRMLLKRGEEVNAVGSEGDTALLSAITRDCYANFWELLSIPKVRYPPMLDAALLRACQYVRPTMVERLIEHGADIKASNERGGVLHHAVGRDLETKTAKLVEILVKHGADVHCATAHLLGWTPLMRAAGAGGSHGALKLLEMGASVHALTKTGNNALHLGAKNGRLEVVVLLLDHGADWTAVNKKGKTPAQMTTNESIKALIRDRATSTTLPLRPK